MKLKSIFCFAIILFIVFFFFPSARAALIYQQNFDSLNPGPLNGQDNWLAAADWQVSPESYGGVQGVKASAVSQPVWAYRNVQAFTSGTFRIAVKRSSDDGNLYVVSLGSASGIRSYGAFVRFDKNGKIYQGYSWGNFAEVQGYNFNQWYLVEIVFPNLTQYSVRIFDGSNWGPQTPFRPLWSIYPLDRYDQIGLEYYIYTGIPAPDLYFDSILLTDQISAPTVPVVSILQQLKSDKITPILPMATTTEDTVTFQAKVDSPINSQVKLRVELQNFDASFSDAIDPLESSSTSTPAVSSLASADNPPSQVFDSGFFPSGSTIAVTATSIPDGSYKWRAKAIDIQGNQSDWQEFGTAGNVDFNVKTVPLYTQLESDFPSRLETATWSILQYANGQSGCGFSIANCGCAITSSVMVARYHDFKTDADNNDVNPKNINDWLVIHDGYWSDGDLKWERIPEYVNKSLVGAPRLIYAGPVAFKDIATLDSYLGKSTPDPVILKTKVWSDTLQEYIDHFIVADGKLANTYTIKDPAYYKTKYLTQARDSYVYNYKNDFQELRIYEKDDPSNPRGVDSLSFNLASPAELLITDPQGRKLGKDPISNISYNEIPGGSYYLGGLGDPIGGSAVSESKFIWIPQPISGDYDVKVIGTDTGNYTLETLAYDQTGQSKDTIQKGVTAVNNTQEFVLNYSKQSAQQTEIYRIVSIDVKPGSFPNSINLKSKGVTPVAILSDQFFDARNVVVDSVEFAGAKPLRGKVEDVDNDGNLDLILHFDTQSLELSLTDTEAVLTARLKDRTLIRGKDSVRIIANLESQRSGLLAFIDAPGNLYQQFKAFLVGLAAEFKQIRNSVINYFYSQDKKIISDSCLADNEVADYPIDEKSNPVLKIPKSVPVIISIRNQKTLAEKFKFAIPNVFKGHYHPVELHRCGLYVVREFNFDDKSFKPLPGFRVELWHYGFDGRGNVILALAGENNTGKAEVYFSYDFRVDPTETYVVLERGYFGQPDYALVIKNLKTKEDSFVLPFKEIMAKYPNDSGSIGFNEWTQDGKYFWGNIFDGAYVLVFFRIEAGTWKWELFNVPKGTMGGDALNPEKGLITYDTGIPWTGIDVLTQELNREYQKQGKINSFYVHNLFTKEKNLVATTTDGAWSFHPNWISATELEYDAPPSGEKKIYKIQ